MTSAQPVHVGAALLRRGYPFSSWPWRALAYLATTVPIAGVLSAGMLVVGAPLFAAVKRYANASGARATIVSAPTGRLVVKVSDDGRGGADPARGSGLTGLADRVAAAGGRLLLASPPGGPTLVRLELPCRP